MKVIPTEIIPANKLYVLPVTHPVINLPSVTRRTRTFTIELRWSNTHTDKSCHNKGRDVAKHARDGDEKSNDHSDHTFIFGVFDDDKKEISQVSPDVLVDCGATPHIVNDISKFISFRKDCKPIGHYIELADGTKSHGTKSHGAEKTGTVNIELCDEDGII